MVNTFLDFPGGSDSKESPAMWETWVRSLGWEDLLEEEMATLSSILAWRIPWTEEPGRLQSMGSQRVRHDRMTNTHTHTHAHTRIFSVHKEFVKEKNELL